MHVCMHACMHACMYVCMCVFMCTCVFLYARMYVCLSVCMHACMHVCMKLLRHVGRYVRTDVRMRVCVYVHIVIVYAHICATTYNMHLHVFEHTILLHYALLLPVAARSAMARTMHPINIILNRKLESRRTEREATHLVDSHVFVARWKKACPEYKCKNAVLLKSLPLRFGKVDLVDPFFCLSDIDICRMWATYALHCSSDFCRLAIIPRIEPTSHDWGASCLICPSNTYTRCSGGIWRPPAVIRGDVFGVVSI